MLRGAREPTRKAGRPASWRASDAFAVLRRFTGRLLVIAGEHDAVIPHEVIERIGAAAADAAVNRLHVVPRAGHVGLFADEREYLRALELMAGLLGLPPAVQ